MPYLLAPARQPSAWLQPVTASGGFQPAGGLRVDLLYVIGNGCLVLQAPARTTLPMRHVVSIA
jgi:hypothetical protein